MKAVSNLCHLYQRVSSALQLAGTGLDRQLEATRKYIEENGLEVVRTYSDRGVSAFRGKNRRVGELSLILQHIESGVIRPGEHLIIESVDRLSRQPPLEALETLKLVLAKGVIVHSIFDNARFTLDDLNRDIGRLLTLMISMSRANEESRIKSERVAKAHAIARERGTITAGSIPSWCEKVDDPVTGQKRFAVKPDIAAIVRDIFEMSAQGMSSYKIGKTLTERGISAFGPARRRLGSKSEAKTFWQATTIVDTITSRRVLGEFRSHTVSYDEAGKRVLTLAKVNPAYYPQIIDADLWQRANAALTSRIRHKSRGRTGESFSNILKDIIVCDHCGLAMHMRSQKDKRTGQMFSRIRCSGRTENICENSKSPRYAPIEDAILEFVTEIELEDSRSDEVAALDRLIAAGESRIISLTDEIRTIITTFKGSAVAVEMVAEKEAERAGLQSALEANRTKRDAIATRQSPADRKTALLELRQRMANSTGEELYAIRVALNQKIRETIDQIRFRNDGSHAVFLSDQSRFYVMEEVEGGFRVSKTVAGSIERKPEVEASYEGVEG